MARVASWVLIALACAATALAAQVEVSENPVKGDQVVISWPANLGPVRVTIYGFTGEQLHDIAVSASSNEYVWDLMVGGGTRRVVNGAYLIVVTAGGQHLQRRLFVARPAPGP